jgi:hypothetical protein
MPSVDAKKEELVGIATTKLRNFQEQQQNLDNYLTESVNQKYAVLAATADYDLQKWK